MPKPSTTSTRKPSRLRLAANWRRLHRTYTVSLSLLLVLLSAVQDQWPLFQSIMTPQRFAMVSLVMGVAIAVLRYIEQPSTAEENHDAQQ